MATISNSGTQPAQVAIIQNGTEALPASGEGARVQYPNQRPRRDPYNRCTKHQTKEMEKFFKYCTHPEEEHRLQIGNLLGMDSMKVKFWFQNKRTQVKGLSKRHHNALLIAENERLRAENLEFNKALSNANCRDCGGQPSVGDISFKEQQLMLENAQLKEEIEKMAAKYYEKPAETSFSNLPPPPPAHTLMPSRSLDVGNYVPQPSMVAQVQGGSTDPLRSNINAPFTEHERACIMELAIGAIEEFTTMARDGVPLWISGFHAEILNQQEYARAFLTGLAPTPVGFRSEASRETMIVIMNPRNLIEILMDVNQWSTMFPDIVSRARTTEILSNGVSGNYDGALQAMSAEFQVLSHTVPTRDSYFLRYCKLHPNGAWIVVDISLDYMRPGAATKCRRRPSGCMIQELPNGLSKVTWVEHVDVEDKEVQGLFKRLVNSGFAFGAKRWIETLNRQCERLACTMASNVPQENLSGISSEGRKSVLKLAATITQSYCNYVGASPLAHVWTVQTIPPTSDNDVRVMMRNHTNTSGAIIGLVVSAAISFSLPVPSKMLFDFLQDKNSRHHWDILTYGFQVQELAHIASGLNPGNFVSILHANSVNVSQSSKIIVQETWTNSTGSYVVYAPFELGTMNLVLSGLDQDYSMVQASGFAILPDGPALSSTPITDVGSGGCLGTFSYQVFVGKNSAQLPHVTASLLCNLMKGTIERIQAAMMSVSTPNC